VFEDTTRSMLRRELTPVARRGTWVAWGLALQTIGVGIPVTVALRRANQDGVFGSVTHYTVRLVWHEMLRSHADVGLLLLGAVVFVVGAVIMARPFVRRRAALLVGVPAAAAAGLALLGVLALVCAAVIAAIDGSGDPQQLFDGISWPGGGRRKRRR
jgi:hypothetical protein